MKTETITHLYLNKTKPGQCPLMRVVGDYEHLLKHFSITVISEAEFWTIAEQFPDFMRYLAWKDSQREPRKPVNRVKPTPDTHQPTLL